MNNPAITLLIATSDPKERAVISNSFTQDADTHYILYEADNAVMLLDLCKQVQPNGLLLFESLPDMSLIDILTRLRPQIVSQRLAVILLVNPAYREGSNLLQALRLGVHDYIDVTTMTAEEVQRVVKEAVGQMNAEQRLNIEHELLLYSVYDLQERSANLEYQLANQKRDLEQTRDLLAVEAQARAALKNELWLYKNHLGRLYDVAQEGIWVFDAENRTRHTNQALLTMLNCDRKHLADKTLLDFVPPSYQEHVRGHIRDLRLNQMRTYRVPLQIPPEQAHLYIQLSVSPLFDPHGHFNGSIATLMVVPQAQFVLQQMIQLIPEPTIICDVCHPDIRILAVNDVLANLIGYDAGMLIHTSIYTLFETDAAKATLRDAVDQIIVLHRGSQLTMPLLHQNGMVFPVEIAITPLLGQEGESLHCAVRIEKF